MERLGGAGGTKEIRVLVEYYGRDEFLEVILRSRRVSERTRRFFKLVLRPSPPAATDQLVIL
ncbi:MAG: hypothetical protein D6679_04955 [Candidatus Hydrogenedentota bacterium]|nr:MAG: hypothetical protein D6679_04955 [Candidatus Hydrogenedentota bacterium]